MMEVVRKDTPPSILGLGALYSLDSLDRPDKQEGSFIPVVARSVVQGCRMDMPLD